MSRKKNYLIVFTTLVLVTFFLIFYTKNEDANKFHVTDNLNTLNLITHEGKSFTLDLVLGNPSIFFFGFLNCPDICPNTLSEISDIIEKLGKDSNKINFFFVTVDPERDNLGNMKNYLSNFNKQIVGITGNERNIKEFLKSMYIYYEKVYLEDDFYTLDHSSQLYIFKKNGVFFGTITLEEKFNIILKKIHAVL